MYYAEAGRTSSQNKKECMMSRPEISIVIPIYNDEKYLRETLDRVAGQIFRDIEISVLSTAQQMEQRRSCMNMRSGTENLRQSITQKITGL